jgi:hypothetical protein
MIFATDLSRTARAELVAFCAENLRSELDASIYADGLIAEADFSNHAHFEIRGSHTRTGSPVTISFSDETDFEWTQLAD